MKTYTKDGVEWATYESQLEVACRQYEKKYGGSVMKRDKASYKNQARGKHNYVWVWKTPVASLRGIDT